MITKIKNFVRSLVGAEKKSKSDNSSTSSTSTASKNTHQWRSVKKIRSRPGLLSFSEMNGSVGVVKEPVTAWKAVRDGIVKLKLPAGTRVISPIGHNKLRADRAVVDMIFKADAYGENFDTPADFSLSIHDPFFQYRTGEKVTPDDDFDKNPATTCSDGIHFYARELWAKKHYKRYNATSRSTRTRRKTPVGVGSYTRTRSRP